MKFKILFLFMLIFFSNNIISQTDENINPKGKWFFGAEIGLNTITSLKPNHENSIQGGILAEYYFAQHWSLSGRIKYFKTGVSYKNDSAYRFYGSVISIPVNANWEYRIMKNFSGNLKLGLALNQEIKSDYYYPTNAKTNYSTLFGTFNPGIGFNYYLNRNTAIFMNYEVYILGNDRDENDGGMNFVPNSTNNNLFNIGIKYSFKKDNKK